MKIHAISEKPIQKLNKQEHSSSILPLTNNSFPQLLSPASHLFLLVNNFMTIVKYLIATLLIAQAIQQQVLCQQKSFQKAKIDCPKQKLDSCYFPLQGLPKTMDSKCVGCQLLGYYAYRYGKCEKMVVKCPKGKGPKCGAKINSTEFCAFQKNKRPVTLNTSDIDQKQTYTHIMDGQCPFNPEWDPDVSPFVNCSYNMANQIKCYKANQICVVPRIGYPRNQPYSKIFSNSSNHYLQDDCNNLIFDCQNKGPECGFNKDYCAFFKDSSPQTQRYGELSAFRKGIRFAMSGSCPMAFSRQRSDQYGGGYGVYGGFYRGSGGRVVGRSNFDIGGVMPSGFVSGAIGNERPQIKQELGGSVKSLTIQDPSIQKPIQKTVQQNAQKPVQSLLQRPNQQPIQKTVQRSVQTAVQRPTQKPIQRSVQKTIQQKTAQRSVQTPIQRQIQKPIQRSVQKTIQQKTAQRSVQTPIQRQIQKTVQRSVQKPIQQITAQRSVQMSLQKPVQRFTNPQ